MKLRYFLPILCLSGLAACGQEVSSPSPSAEAALRETAPAPKTLGGQDDEITAEEIQQRREDWVGADATSSSASSRIASADASSRE
jgi:hypothetical protein